MEYFCDAKAMVIDMETIRSIGASVCITMIVTGIFSILIPGKAMEKTVQMAVGLFFLASIVLPIANGDWKGFMSVQSTREEVSLPDLEQTVEQNMIELTQEQLCEQAKALLGAEGITAKQVSVTVHIDGDNSITITEILIVLPKEEVLNFPLAGQVIKDGFQIEPKIMLEGDG